MVSPILTPDAERNISRIRLEQSAYPGRLRFVWLYLSPIRAVAAEIALLRMVSVEILPEEVVVVEEPDCVEPEEELFDVLLVFLIDIRGLLMYEVLLW